VSLARDEAARTKGTESLKRSLTMSFNGSLTKYGPDAHENSFHSASLSKYLIGFRKDRREAVFPYALSCCSA
jgi:hypothetical protein